MTDEEKIKKIKELRDNFLKQAAEAQKRLTVLRQRQLKLLEKVMAKKDQDQINQILNSIK